MSQPSSAAPHPSSQPAHPTPPAHAHPRPTAAAQKELEGLESLAKYNDEERKRMRVEQRRLAEMGNSDEDEDEEQESIMKRGAFFYSFLTLFISRRFARLAVLVSSSFACFA